MPRSARHTGWNSEPAGERRGRTRVAPGEILVELRATSANGSGPAPGRPRLRSAAATLHVPGAAAPGRRRPAATRQSANRRFPSWVGVPSSLPSRSSWVPSSSRVDRRCFDSIGGFRRPAPPRGGGRPTRSAVSPSAEARRRARRDRSARGHHSRRAPAHLDVGHRPRARCPGRGSRRSTVSAESAAGSRTSSPPGNAAASPISAPARRRRGIGRSFGIGARRYAAGGRKRSSNLALRPRKELTVGSSQARQRSRRGRGQQRPARRSPRGSRARAGSMSPGTRRPGLGTDQRADQPVVAAGARDRLPGRRRGREHRRAAGLGTCRV